MVRGPQPIEVDRSAPAGAPIELTTSVHGEAVWGQPDVDLAAVTCVASRSDGSSVDLPVGTVEGRPTQADDVQGGTWFWLTTTDGRRASSSVTCSGGGLETVGVTDDPGDGTRGNPGAPFLVFAAFLVVLGLVLRRVSAPRAR